MQKSNYKKEWNNEDIIKMFNSKMTIDEFANQRNQTKIYLKEIYNNTFQKTNNIKNEKVVFYF